MPIEALEITDKSWQTLSKLADITGLTDTDIPKLVQDALRVYEWILSQQVQSRTIVALEESDLSALDRIEPEKMHKSLKPLFVEEKESEARAFFEQHG
jgi:hypothetical protein